MKVEPAAKGAQQPHAPGKGLVLVTGGAGFIGSHLVDALIGRGFAVRVIDNFATGRPEQVNPAAELIRADIRDLAAIREAFNAVACVFHVAALPRVPISIERPIETHMTNVVGTLTVLVAARDAGVKRFIYSGSSSVYGTQPALPLREDMAPNPLSPYALQKLVGEQYARLFHQLYGMETLTLRYFNVFGPRMAEGGAYSTVISAFLRAWRAGQPLPINGDGEQTRDFTHVRDVVRASLLAMDCPLADGRALNIGRGRAVSVKRLAELVGGPTVLCPPRIGEPRHTLADCTQAREVLGWQSEIGVEQGIAELQAAG